MKKTLIIMGVVVCFIFSGIMLLHSQGDISEYQHKETKDIVTFVNKAAKLVETKGEEVFPELKKQGANWKKGDKYIFVLDTEGNVVVSPDPALEGTNQIGLKDQDGKLIVKGLIKETTGTQYKTEGWLHYQMTVPGSIFTKWKTTFAKRAQAPSGKIYVVCSGLFDMPMEREFVVNTVDKAVALIDKEGKDAFPKLRDRSTQFIYKDTYVFVDNPDGIELVNPAFPEIEGTSLLDYKDPEGKYFTRELISLALNKGSGWVNYLWPRPGQSAPSRKHTYAKKAQFGDEVYIVGVGTYLQSKVEEMANKLRIFELKTGEKFAAELIKKTENVVYLAHPDGSMQVSYPRSKIDNIRRLTGEELEKIRTKFKEAQKDKEKQLTDLSI